MKHVWMVAVLVCVVLTSSAFAQTPRSLGMGNTAYGVADDGAAWFQNPAGLGGLNVVCQEDKEWANDIIGFVGDNGDSRFGITWSGFQPVKAQGFGAGYIDEGNIKRFGAGFGMNWKETPLSVGLNIVREDPDGLDSNTLFNLGFMYKFARPDADPIRAGLVISDLTDEANGPQFNVGIAWPVNPQLLLAADINDLTDEDDTTFDFGAEYYFGDQYEWAARAGANDGDLTLGAGYAFANNWRLDAAWADTDGDSTWLLGAGLNF